MRPSRTPFCLGAVMLPFKLIYHEGYDLHLGAHVFPSQKFRLIAERLLAGGMVVKEDLFRPAAASDEDIQRVHTQDWVRKLKTGTLTPSEQMKLEVPYSQELVHAFWLAAGGTIAAAQFALRDGFACNIGGGFHHAFRSYLVLQRWHSIRSIFPLIGITGMMKNNVMNRIAVFSTN